jgi:hypothetical protein
MMARVEFNNDITRSEPIREVTQINNARASKATKKNYEAELGKRFSRKKKKDAGDGTYDGNHRTEISRCY